MCRVLKYSSTAALRDRLRAPRSFARDGPHMKEVTGWPSPAGGEHAEEPSSALSFSGLPPPMLQGTESPTRIPRLPLLFLSQGEASHKTLPPSAKASDDTS